MYIIIFFYFYNMNIKQIDVIQLKKRQTIEEKKKEENSINKPTPTSIFIFIKHDILSKGLLTYQAMKNLPHNSIQRRTRK